MAASADPIDFRTEDDDICANNYRNDDSKNSKSIDSNADTYGFVKIF